MCVDVYRLNSDFRLKAYTYESVKQIICFCFCYCYYYFARVHACMNIGCGCWLGVSTEIGRESPHAFIESNVISGTKPPGFKYLSEGEGVSCVSASLCGHEDEEKKVEEGESCVPAIVRGSARLRLRNKGVAWMHLQPPRASRCAGNP